MYITCARRQTLPNVICGRRFAEAICLRIICAVMLSLGLGLGLKTNFFGLGLGLGLAVSGLKSFMLFFSLIIVLLLSF